MNDNQRVGEDVLQQLTEVHRHAPTVSRFIEEHFSDLVSGSDYFTRLVRDDVGGEMLPPLPEEVTRADAVRVGGEFGVVVCTIECYLAIWQKTNAIESVSRGHYRRVTV